MSLVLVTANRQFTFSLQKRGRETCWVETTLSCFLFRGMKSFDQLNQGEVFLQIPNTIWTFNNCSLVKNCCIFLITLNCQITLSKYKQFFKMVDDTNLDLLVVCRMDNKWCFVECLCLEGVTSKNDKGYVHKTEDGEFYLLEFQICCRTLDIPKPKN